MNLQVQIFHDQSFPDSAARTVFELGDHVPKVPVTTIATDDDTLNFSKREHRQEISDVPEPMLINRQLKFLNSCGLPSSVRESTIIDNEVVNESGPFL